MHAKSYSVCCRDPGVLSECKFDTEEEESVLMTNIKHRLTPHPVKIRAGKVKYDFSPIHKAFALKDFHHYSLLPLKIGLCVHVLVN